MKHILFVAAEHEEIRCAEMAFEIFKEKTVGLAEFEFMDTGIGTTNTAYKLTKAIIEAKAEGKPYDLIIEIGLAGSYDLKKLPVRSAAIVSTEYAADLGFDTPEGLKTLFDTAYWDKDSFPYKDGGLHRTTLPYENLENLLGTYTTANGVTVQTVTGNMDKLEENRRQFHADVESMEGSALYYITLMENIPFFEIRTISNAVGVSDSSKWDNAGARETLTRCCKEIIDKLIEDVK